MLTGFGNNYLQEFSDYIALETGLFFPEERWNDMERNLRSISKDFGYNDVKSFVRWIASGKCSKEQIEIMAHHLTVGETYFFREKNCFEILRKQLIPELIKLRENNIRTIRIWSAGCCTGEEAYSVAILLKELIPDIHRWSISILGTDLNTKFLKKAERGIYSVWSFRENSDWIQEKYFKKHGHNEFEIIPAIRNMVKFSYLNLVEDAFPSLLTGTHSIDFLFCRNVLMYFSNETARKIINRFYKSITDEGWLLLSSVETNIIRDMQLNAVMISGQTFYRKNLEKYHAADSNVAESFPFYTDEAKVDELPVFHFIEEAKDNVETIIPEGIVHAKKEAVPVDGDKELYREATEDFEQGNYGKAIEKLQTLVSKNHGRNAAAAMLLAKSYANQGNLLEAYNMIELALKTDKTNVEYHFYHATILQAAGKMTEALESFRKVLFLDHDLVVAHFAIASILQNIGKQKEAQKYYNNSLSLLEKYDDDDVLTASEGITAGRLKKIILAVNHHK